MSEELSGIEPTELLDHAEFLRGLIRNLVLDEQTSEDVLQETWITALRNPPANRGALRSWLATVARNFALKARRSRISRQQREQRVGMTRADDVEPATETVVNYRIVLQDVTGAVTDLGEQHQEVVFLRFYEQLPPRKIAERLGLPVETVRSRTRRALEQLREKLKEKHGNDWRRLLVPLLPPGLLESMARPSLLSSGMGVVGGGLFLAAVITVLLIVQPWAGKPLEKVIPEPEKDLATNNQSITPKHHDSPWQGGKPIALPQSQNQFIFTGKVVDQAGRPIAAAQVNGSLHFPLDPRLARAQGFKLSGSKPDHVFEKAGREPLFPRKIMTQALSAAMLKPGSPAFQTVTNSAGEFSIKTPWQQTWLWAEKKLLACHTASKGYPGGTNTLVLLPGSDLKVKVETPDGKPIAGVPVRLLSLHRVHLERGMIYPVAPWRQQRTNSKGMTNFIGLRANEKWIAMAIAPTLAPTCSSLYTSKRNKTGSLLIRTLPAHQLKVQILDGNEKPLAGALVRVTAINLPPPCKAILPPWEGLTNDQGYFQLDELPAGRFYIDAYLLGRKPAQKIITIEKPQFTQTKLRLARGLTISGQVVYRDGNPVEGALVGLLQPTSTMNRKLTALVPHHCMSPTVMTKTDEKGHFKLSGLPNRPLQLSASSSAFSVQMVSVDQPTEGNEITFRLERTGSLKGKLVNPAGQPVHNFSMQVWLNSPGSNDIFYFHQDFETTDGHFQLTNLKPGLYDIVAEAKGYGRTSSQNIKIRSGETIDLGAVLRMNLPSRIKGMVIDHANGPLPGLRLELVPVSSTAASGSFLSPHLTISSVDGQFTFQDVPPGWWEIRSEGDPRGWVRSPNRYHITENKTIRDIKLNLHPPAILKGHVYNNHGQPAQATTVLAIEQASSRREVWSLTDNNGAFQIKNLQPGRWWVRAIPPSLYEAFQLRPQNMFNSGRFQGLRRGQYSQGVEIDIWEGNENRIILGNPQAGNCTLAGRIIIDGNPLEGIPVFLVPQKNDRVKRSPRAVITDKNGNYRFTGFAPGPHQISVQLENQSNTQFNKKLTIKNTKQDHLDINFGKGRVEGLLSAGEGITDIEGLHVWVQNINYKDGIFFATGTSNHDGRFQVSPLPPGKYIAVVGSRHQAPGAPVGWAGPFTLPATSASNPLTITLRPSATLIGNAEKSKWAGSLVIVKAKNWVKSYSVRVDTEGIFRIDGLPPDKAILSITSPDKQKEQQVFTFQAGKINRISFW